MTGSSSAGQQPTSPSPKHIFGSRAVLASPTTPTYADLGRRLYTLDEVRGWSEKQVVEWLMQFNFGRFKARFIDNNITGAVLLDLDNDALKDMGIKTVGERVRLLVAVKSLRQDCYTQAAWNARSRHDNQRIGIEYRFGNQSTTSVATGSTFHLDGKHEGYNVTSPHPEKSSKSSETKSLLNRSNSFSRFLGRSDSKKSMRSGTNVTDAPPMPPSPKTVQKRSSLEGGIMSMEKVKQTCVKVFGEEGQTRIVNMHNATDAKSIMTKVLHKFGIDEMNADRYCIFVGSSTNGEARALSDVELTEICRSTDRPEKERLILRKRHQYPTHEEFKRKGTVQARMQLQQRWMNDSESLHETTPSPRSGWIPDKHTLDSFMTGSPSMHSNLSRASTRASMRSINNTPHGQPNARVRRFFGERPPSELISSNLPSFFPNHRREVLETAGINAKRLSMTRTSSMSRPDHPFSVRNSVMPELVSVLGVDLGKFLEEEDDEDDEEMETASEASETSSSDSSIHETSNARLANVRDPPEIQRRSSSLSHLNGEKPLPAPVAAAAAAAAANAAAATAMAEKQATDRKDERKDIKAKRAPTPDREEEEKQEEQEEEGENTLVVSSVETKSTTTTTLEGKVPPEKEMHSLTPLVADDDTIDSWMKGSLIGRGTFGDVYLGLNPLSGELMAVKQVELPVENTATEGRKRSMVEALQREIALLKDLQHENIVQYLGSHIDVAHFSIFLEYVPGGSVAGLLASYGAFQEPLVKSFVRQILKGLNYLHGKDIVHRDIKGANVLVDNKGGVKISDFGISKKVEEDIMQVSSAPNRPSLQGSVFWMAPEVVKQTHYTRKADIWSLGCMVVEMFTGDHPFPEFSQMQAIFKIGSYTAPTIPENLSEEASDFLRCTFKLNHEERPSAKELLDHPFLV